MKKLKKILAVVLSLCLIIGITNITAFAGNQVTNSGGTNVSDEVTVSKTISETGTENLFDITLRVESTKEAASYIKQPSMAIAIVLDVSSTMFQNNRYYPAREAMKEFITRYCADSVGAYTPRELSIITFNTNAEVMYPLSDCKDKLPASIMNSVDNGMKPIIDDVMAYNSSEERFTNMEAGLKLADNILSNSKADNKYILLFTDGVPTTYINRSEADFDSTDYLKGYCPITSSGTVGADGVFYNVPTSQYCSLGTNYSDKGALYAVNQANAIKYKNIKIYSVGIQIDTQTPVEDMNKNTVDYDGVGDYVINTSTEQLFDSSVWNYKYKNWLYSDIGSGCYYDGNNFEQLTNVCSDIYSRITDECKTTMEDKWKAKDPMNSDSSNKNIEFMSLFNKEGTLTNSLSGMSGANKENTASFDTDNEKINWDILNSGYTITNVNGSDKYVYELKYRVRLKNEKNGFLSNTSLPANGETTLKYVAVENGVVTDKIINFPIPEVKGYLANLEFTKVDGLNDDIGGTPLSGAKFKLTHSDSCHQCIEIGKHIDIADKNVDADAAGQVSFSDIPSGHCYDLLETVAPEGYICPSVAYSVEVKEGIVYINGNRAGTTLGNEPDKFELNYVITSSDNPAIDKTDVTPSTKTDIPYNRDVTLESDLTTTDTTDKNGVPGTWTFNGWYDNAECTGEPILTKNIKKDETVYGKWSFAADTYKLNYVIVSTENPSTDKTGETPATKTDIAYNTDETLAPVLTTTDDKKGDVPGTWTFSGWYDNAECTGEPILTKNIKKDETVYGKWSFVVKEEPKAPEDVPAGDNWNSFGYLIFAIIVGFGILLVVFIGKCKTKKLA